jgi:hypothetical protein
VLRRDRRAGWSRYPYGIEHLKFADTALCVADDSNPIFESLCNNSRNIDVCFATLKYAS